REPPERRFCLLNLAVPASWSGSHLVILLIQQQPCLFGCSDHYSVCRISVSVCVRSCVSVRLCKRGCHQIPLVEGCASRLAISSPIPSI
uniref:Uncharacterized protein n=1 Tax=Anopheles quadriannulatus TaxID=34691 RepID=A0A182XS19_ANOQN